MELQLKRNLVIDKRRIGGNKIIIELMRSSTTFRSRLNEEKKNLKKKYEKEK